VYNRKIQWPATPVWLQKKGYCSDMPNVVSAIDGTSHEIQILSNEPQQQFGGIFWSESHEHR
jgi:hypothetical protein